MVKANVEINYNKFSHFINNVSLWFVEIVATSLSLPEIENVNEISSN